jgi:hypothetical protein
MRLKTASEMTVEEFKQELRRIREKALRIYANQHQANRPKAQQKRGDFYGKGRR